MTKTDTIGDLNKLTINLEHTAEATYRGLAVMFPHEPEIVRFFNLLADEEVSHAHWLENLQNSLEDHQLRKQVDSRFGEGARLLLQTSPEVRLQDIRNFEEALQLARNFGTAETNAIFDFLISDYSLATKAREFLRNQVGVHVERLNKGIPDRFQDRLARLEVAVKKQGLTT